MQNLNTILAYAYANLTKTDILDSLECLDIEDDNYFVTNEMRALTLCPSCSCRKSRRKDKVLLFSFETTVLGSGLGCFIC